ncbi:MAG: sigma-54-dependent Fis family transcriptional regulator [Alphaproteobacteria bacterium]|nr:sigma-54-dependent Fis family transcriptional regulator [Alphaproteobacteria bacterium]
MNATILLAEDNEMQRVMMRQLLEKKLGYSVVMAERGSDVLPALRADSSIGVVLLDLNMPDMNGFEVMEQMRSEKIATPVIILTASSEIEKAIRGMRLGALDFITKPPDRERLKTSINNALRIGTLTDEVAKLRREKSGILHFDDLIGHDTGLKDAVHMARKAASCTIPVCITGETGVGKELMARAIHGQSERSDKPFIAVNCGAIPENLVESTLFGHVKGAFTGAVSDALGKFREANGGTLFLDEIGDLPLPAQVKLLRALQQQEVEPVGAARAINVDVRIISATNRDLAADVRAGRFREDVYFRLNVLPVHVPPLRARRDDIVVLTRHCITQAITSERLPERSLSPEARTLLENYYWPGNVRELLNVVRRAMVLSESNMLLPSDFPSLTETRSSPLPPISAPRPMALDLLDASGNIKPLEIVERETLRHALVHCAGNITKAAASLRIAKSTFYKKMVEE